MTYVFDIDGTICNNVGSDYSLAERYKDRIDYINKLYDEGNEIVFFTARGMKRYRGNIQKVYKNYYDFTECQLRSWNVKYHKLILGKPSADLYIDDKGAKDEDFFRANIRP